MSAGATKAREAGVAIQVLGRDYRVSCPPGEETRLQQSVDVLNQRIAQLRDGGKVVGNERLAIMAALNIAHELVSAQPDGRRAAAPAAPVAGVDAADMRRRIAAMQEALEAALGADQEKLF